MGGASKNPRMAIFLLEPGKTTTNSLAKNSSEIPNNCTRELFSMERDTVMAKLSMEEELFILESGSRVSDMVHRESKGFLMVMNTRAIGRME